MVNRHRAGLRRRIQISVSVLITGLILPAGAVLAQNSFPLYDLMPLSRGGALGGQALAGDLLAAGIDPTVAMGDPIGVEFAGGSHVLELKWAAAGTRLEVFERPVAVTFSTLSYGEQFRTDMDDRLGLFRGSFTPSDMNMSVGTVLLSEKETTIGAGFTLSFGQLDDARAFGLSGAVAARQWIGIMELRGGISNLGTVLSSYGTSDGTRMPARLRAGAALPVWGDKLEFSGEVVYRFGDAGTGLSAGVEWLPLPAAALRVGVIHGDGGDVLSDGFLSDLGLTAGFAWQFSDWRISYVYRPGGLLGSGHLFAVGWRLGALR